MTTTKFVYTYDVKHVNSGRRIAVGFANKERKLAESLALAAINNRPGHDFKVVRVSKPNPEYTGV